MSPASLSTSEQNGQREPINQLYEAQTTPTFAHLTEFVQSCAAVANTYFGQIVNSKQEAPRGHKSSSKGKVTFSNNSMTLATFGDESWSGGHRGGERKPFKCVLCSGSHHLECCHKFRELILCQRQTWWIRKGCVVRVSVQDTLSRNVELQGCVESKVAKGSIIPCCIHQIQSAN